MTEDERSDWIQQLLASADAKAVKVCEEEVDEKDPQKEDFGSKSE